MSGFTDWTDLGLFPLQDHAAKSDKVPVAVRQMIAGGRIVKMKDPSAASSSLDTIVEYGKVDGMGTLGDLHPWSFWQTADREKRGCGAWAQLWGSVVVKPNNKYSASQVLPILDAGWKTDIRFGDMHPSRPDCFPWPVVGQATIVIPAMDEDKQHDLAYHADPRLICPNTSGPGEAGTLVVDLQPEGVMCIDGATVPGIGGRQARLQSLMRVVAMPDAGWPGFHGPGNILALNHTRSGADGLMGYGAVFAELSGGGSSSPGPITPGSYTGKSHTMHDYGEFKSSRSGSGGIALMAFNGAYGPIHPGGTKDQHKFGQDKDGHPINSAHIAVGALYYGDQYRDGPLKFETSKYPDPPSWPLTAPVHLSWDPKATHPWHGGSRPGMWKWWCEVPQLEGGGKPGRGSGEPPKSGGGGGLSRPRIPQVPDIPWNPTPPRREPTIVPRPQGGGGGGGKGDPWERSWNDPLFRSKPGGIGSIPLPPDPPPHDPKTGELVHPGDGWIFDQGKSRWIWVGPGPKPVSPYDPEFETHGMVEHVGGASPELVGAYQVFNPMMTGFSAMSFRPQLWVSGYPNFEHFPKFPAGLYRDDENYRPQVMAARAWGNQSDSGGWEYEENPWESRAEGGTCDGGMLLSPPEFEMEDYFGINSQADVKANTDTSRFFTFAPGVGMAFGTPVTTGSVAENSIVVAQKPYTDDSNEPLTIAQVDSSGKKIVVMELEEGSVKIGDIAGGNYTEVESDGTMVAVGDAVVWDDQQVNMGDVVSSGWSANDWCDVVEFLSGAALEFKNSTTVGYKIRFNAQLSHKYHTGEDIEFHIHVGNSSGNSGDVRFNFKYQWASTDSVFPSSYTVSKTVEINGVEDNHQYITFGTIDGSDAGISSILLCELERESDHADDDFSESVYVIGLDFHIPIDTMGSRGAISK